MAADSSIVLADLDALRRGIETGPELGVAPPTLEHRRALAACAAHPG